MRNIFNGLMLGISILFCTGTMRVAAQTAVSDNPEMTSILAYMQRAMRFNQAAPQEKVYLHFDNTGYFKGETIRFKAYVKRMDTDKPSAISTVLYVELVNPIGDVCERRTLKISNGEADGDIKLDSIVGASGFYEVRAFTRYMTNWGTPAVFSRVFPIFNKPKEDGNYTNAVIDKVGFRHRLPNTRVDDEGKVAESTTDLALNSVKFYPEGGDLVRGLTSRVAVAVTNKEGRHLAVKGSLLNAQKQKIGTVETDDTGRGVFDVVAPAGGAMYVQLPDEKGKMKDYQLPEAKTDGCVLRHGEDRRDLVHVQVGLVAGQRHVHRIQPGVHDNTGQQALHPHPGLQCRRHKAGDHAGQHGGRQRKPGIPGDRHQRADCRAEGEAAVRRQVAHIQHRIAQEQAQDRQGIHQAQFHRRLAQGQEFIQGHISVFP